MCLYEGKDKNYEAFIEQAAYTWFNRIMAIRFMELNDMLPSHTRMFSFNDGSFGSQAVKEALDIQIEGVDQARVIEYKQASDDEALFRYLFLEQCNELSTCMPQVFDPVGSALELLLPDGLLRKGSVIERMVADIPEEDWREGVEIVGWMYQYYNAERKDEVFASFKKGKKADRDLCAEIACREWMDVRSFGQVFAFKGAEVSLGIRGPVSIHQAVSASPVDTVSMQITKSVNSEAKEGGGKASDTMGTKHRVSFGLYTIKGSVNVQLAEKTGFSQEDAELLKEALKTLFENDASSARPEGSMEVCKMFWWQHEEKTPSVSTAKIHRSVKVEPKPEVDRPKAFSDYNITYEYPGCVEPEVFDFV